MNPSNSNVRRLELVGGRVPAKLPPYMFRRGETYYFKRKIPAGAAEAFPDYKEQVWKSLETNLLTKAKVTLPLFCGVHNPRFTRPFCAVPRTSVFRTASG